MRTRRRKIKAKKMKPESTHPTTFFFVKPKEGLAGGTTTAKTSPPPGDGSGIAGNGATEEARAGAAEELCTGGAVELGTEATKELNTGASKEVGAGASEELIPDVRLLQKSSRLKVKTKKRNSMQKEYEKQLTAA